MEEGDSGMINDMSTSCEESSLLKSVCLHVSRVDTSTTMTTARASYRHLLNILGVKGYLIFHTKSTFSCVLYIIDCTDMY